MYKFEEFVAEGHKILILGEDKRYFTKYRGIAMEDLYRDRSSSWWKGFTFKVREHGPVCFRKGLYGGWVKNPAGYDLIIIMLAIRGRDLAEYLRKYNPEARIIVYYNDLMYPGTRHDPARYQGLGIEYYSFDPVQCEKYDFAFNSYWLSPEVVQEAAQRWGREKIQQEVYFCGAVRNRLDKIMRAKQMLTDLGINLKATIVGEKKKKYPEEARWQMTFAWRPYEEILENIVKSKAVLDITQYGQSGITLRPVEALFLQKKLITDNPYVKKYDFYCRENIFIIDEDDPAELKQFLDTPFKEVDREIVKNYTPEAWLDRFF